MDAELSPIRIDQCNSKATKSTPIETIATLGIQTQNRQPLGESNRLLVSSSIPSDVQDIGTTTFTSPGHVRMRRSPGSFWHQPRPDPREQGKRRALQAGMVRESDARHANSAH